MRTDPKAEPEVMEPGGRRHHLTEFMTSQNIAAAYADATRLRAHELSETLDRALGNWMHDARKALAERGHLELIREFLPLYYDPTRKEPVFGPGGKLASQAAIERAIRPGRPLREIAAG